MDITLDRDIALPAVAHAAAVLDHHSSLPVLRNLLIQTEPGGIALVGSNLETEIQRGCPAEIAQGGAVTLPAKKLLDILKALPSGARLRIREDGARATLTAGKGRFVLATLPADDYPRMQPDPAAPSARITIPQATLKTLIEKTVFAVAKQDVRFYLNGLHLHAGGLDLTATATDGHRLARYRIDLPEPIEEPVQRILPRATVETLRRLCDGGEDLITLTIGGALVARLGAVTLTSKWIDGVYPDADRVIPRALPSRARIDRHALLDAARRVALLANEDYRGLRMVFGSDGVTIESSNQEQETASETLGSEHDGPPVTVGFNAAYLAEALNAIATETVDIALTDGNSSALLRGVDQLDETFVLMPMRM